MTNFPAVATIYLASLYPMNGLSTYASSIREGRGDGTQNDELRFFFRSPPRNVVRATFYAARERTIFPALGRSP